MLIAWLMPTPPGVAETVFASELPPATDMTVWKVTGIGYAARKTAITPSFATQAPNDGSDDLERYLRGAERIAPPCFAFSQSPLACSRRSAPSTTSRKSAAADEDDRQQRVVANRPSWSSNDPGTERKR